MSRAIQATTARERANIAAAYIRRGITHTREFGNCFEMYDGDAVVFYLLRKGEKDARILAFAERCGWTAPGYVPAWSEIQAKMAETYFRAARERVQWIRDGRAQAFTANERLNIADARRFNTLGRAWRAGTAERPRGVSIPSLDSTTAS